MPAALAVRGGVGLPLQKPPACGGWEWEVVRVGMDIGIVCTTCNGRVTLVRSELEKRVKRITPQES